MTDNDQNTNTISEDMKISIQLEEIFTPQFRKRREDLYNIQTVSANNKNDKRFVHYTTAESALNIIKTKNIWMRKTSCMSDYLEVEHGFEILRECFNDETRLEIFTKSLDAYFPGVVQEAIKLFDSHLNNIRLNTYIISISEHNDDEDLYGRLSMWRAFSGNAGQVAIIFKIPWHNEKLTKAMSELRLFFSPVVYSMVSNYHDEFNKIIDNINSNKDFLRLLDRSKIKDSIFQMLLICTVCLKHYGFKEEKEWRIIYFPSMWNSELIKSEIKVLDGIPQKIYHLPLDVIDMSSLFDRLIIGPTRYPSVMFEAFSEALLNMGITKAYEKISISKIPIRI